MVQKSTLIQENKGVLRVQMPFGSSDRHPGILPPQETFDDLLLNGTYFPSPQHIAQIQAETRAQVEAEIRAEMEAKYAGIIAENVQLKSLAETDSLTGLYNRRVLLDSLDKKVVGLNTYAGLPTHKRTNDKDELALSFLICDLDYFKKVNDTYGHQAGDEVLKKFSKILKSHLRESDIAGRYGGEEFAAVLPYANLIDSKIIAKRIQENIADTLFLPNNHRVTVSIGLTQVVKGDDSSMVIGRADEALYMAKSNGRNMVEISLAPEMKNYSLDKIIGPAYSR